MFIEKTCFQVTSVNESLVTMQVRPGPPLQSRPRRPPAPFSNDCDVAAADPPLQPSPDPVT